MKSSNHIHHKCHNLLLCAASSNAVRIQYTLNMKRNTLSYLKLISASFLMTLFLLPSCKKTEDVKLKTPKPEVEIFGTEDKPVLLGKIVHLYRDTVYTLNNVLTRAAGEQLIIEDGTLIKVGLINKSGVYSATGGIKIEPGGILIANGTKENPIIFTSRAPNATKSLNWNGIEINGKSFNNDTAPTGSEDPHDRSCSIKYLRVEFSFLTLNAVGGNSVVENVQVSYTKSKPSFEIFGGTFNARNLVSYACGGPADFHITKGYTGKMQNLLAYRHPFFGNPNGSTSGLLIENNPSGDTQAPNTFPIISNLTIIGPHLQNGIAPEYLKPSLQSAALITKNNARFKIRNSIFSGFPKSGWYIDDEQSLSNFTNKTSEIGYSFFHKSDTTFSVRKGLSKTNAQFRDLALTSENVVELTLGADAIYQNPFNYENSNLLVIANSSILKGAKFDAAFSDTFFNKVDYIGAIGNDNWLQGWTNFIPLRTNYNDPK